MRWVMLRTGWRWIEQPDDGGAQLQPSYEWFVYSEAIPVLPFSPTFENPYPLFSGRTLRNGAETAADKQNRLEVERSQRGAPGNFEFGIYGYSIQNSASNSTFEEARQRGL